MNEIRDIMKKCFVVVQPETTMAEAARSLGEHHVDSAPVMSSDRTIVGMISEREMLDLLFDRSIGDLPVAEYMAQNVVTLNASDPLAAAAQLFALHGYRRLPVVENGALVGVVTRRDLLDYALAGGESFSEPLIDLVPELAPLS